VAFRAAVAGRAGAHAAGRLKLKGSRAEPRSAFAATTPEREGEEACAVGLSPSPRPRSALSGMPSIRLAPAACDGSDTSLRFSYTWPQMIPAESVSTSADAR